jgi:hypothetical protein
MSLEQATLAFVQAAIDEIVDDCIAIAKETPLTWAYLSWSPETMRAAIIKRLEEYKTGAVTVASKRTAA